MRCLRSLVWILSLLAIVSPDEAHLGNSCAADEFAQPNSQGTTKHLQTIRQATVGELRSGAKADESLVTLQLREDAELNSPLIRLGDVVRPAGIQPDSWPELAGLAIGILPTDLQRIRLERRRIAEFLETTGRLDFSARWSGPEYVTVRMATPSPLVRRGETTGSLSSANYPRQSDETMATSATPVGLSALGEVPPGPLRSGPLASAAGGAVDASGGRAPRAAFPPGDRSQSTSMSQSSHAGKSSAVLPLTPAERSRLERVILSVFAETHETVAQQYEVALDGTDDRLANLRELQSIVALRLLTPPAAGKIELEVTGEDGTRQWTEVVRVILDPFPEVVFANATLSRGAILSERDLLLKAIPKKQFDPRMATDIQQLVGQEVTRALSSGRPVRMDDVAEPIVVKRGDLVELRVYSGGFRITTQGRALDSGAAGDAVSVEIDQPRRRVLGRAAGHGVVEILSRPPTVSGEPSPQ